MKAKYLVSEIVDEDGGYGDSVETKVPLAVFGNLPDAETYVRKYSKKQWYDRPYDDLYFGELVIDLVASNPPITVEANGLTNYVDCNYKRWE